MPTKEAPTSDPGDDGVALSSTSHPAPERRKTRVYSREYIDRILAETDAALPHRGIRAILRREKLDVSYLNRWRRQRNDERILALARAPVDRPNRYSPVRAARARAKAEEREKEDQKLAVLLAKRPEPVRPLKTMTVRNIHVAMGAVVLGRHYPLAPPVNVAHCFIQMMQSERRARQRTIQLSNTNAPPNVAVQKAAAIRRELRILNDRLARADLFSHYNFAFKAPRIKVKTRPNPHPNPAHLIATGFTTDVFDQARIYRLIVPGQVGDAEDGSFTIR